MKQMVNTSKITLLVRPAAPFSHFQRHISAVLLPEPVIKVVVLCKSTSETLHSAIPAPPAAFEETGLQHDKVNI